MSGSDEVQPIPVSPAVNGGVAAIAARVRVTGRVRFAPDLALLTLFWVFVALSNVLYANRMQTSLNMMGVAKVFAPWNARLVQHLILYTALVGCVWLARRTGWQPLWRTAPIQAVCGLVFSALASPALVAAEMLSSDYLSHQWKDLLSQGTWTDMLAGPERTFWLAGISSFLVIYCFAVALLTGFDYYRRFRDSQLHAAELEQSLTTAQLAALRLQLSPHTLFNLLHTIRGQIAWDPPAAQAMVVQLADLLRRLLRAGDHEFTTLADELEFARLYLQLEQQRFSDRLTVTIPQSVDAPAAWVPSLILQPLVENAVVHGLAGHDAAVTVRVEAIAEGETLILRVINTAARERNPNPDGIGLRNVRERLAIHFGDRATMTSVPRDGTWRAEIRLPVLHNGR